MAQKVQVLLVDDVDGGVAEETVTFALDGTNYEIDLSNPNAKQLRDGLATWISHARRVGGRSAARARSAGSGSTGRASRAAGRPDLAEVRAWARDNGFQVSDRGRVSTQVLQAYESAH
jgi:hypothetical protein